MAFALLTLAAGATEIRVTGSDLLGADFARAVAEFARQNDTPVKLDLRGTRPGMTDLEAGRADVGLFLLPATEPPPGGDVASRVMGYQVAVVAVPAGSSLGEVTFSGLRGNFGAGGQKGLTPFAVSAEAGLAWPLFQRIILQDEAPKAGMEIFADGAALAGRLRAVESGMGVMGLASAGSGGLRVLALAPEPTEPAYLPTPENVHGGAYPLRMMLYVSFPRAKAPELQRFLKYLLSDESAAALAQASFLPLPVGARNQLVFELEEMR